MDAVISDAPPAPAAPARPLNRKLVFVWAGGIFLASQAAFLIGIDQPAKYYFDEFHYIPAALAFVRHTPFINLEHPPLAKAIMALGITLFGDNPLGWRYFSTLFGSFSLVAVYLWALAVFRENRPALFATVITALNQVLFVQARIGMLDIFALAFTLWGLAAFSAAWVRFLPIPRRWLLRGAGAFFGLSAACKWSGFTPLLLVILIVVIVKVFQGWKVYFRNPAPEDWYQPDLWKEIGAGEWLLSLLVCPIGAYYLAYACMGLNALLPLNFIAAQMRIWGDQSTLSGTHPYMSGWLEWPILRRPTLYFFEGAKWDTPDAYAQAVLFLGNPVVAWGGLVATAACLVGWISGRRRDAFIIVAAYAGLWLSWAIIPRHLTFAFYYLPATCVLGLALAYVFYRTPLARRPWLGWGFLIAAGAMFLYFLPISSAAVHVSEPGFNSAMWFKSWR
jgi:dolichyl-phosphate-mannose--protein O-mannosyl transferase